MSTKAANLAIATCVRLTGLESSSSRVPAASSPAMAQPPEPIPKINSMTGSRLAKNWLFR
jgi:hypothetical protein